VRAFYGDRFEVSTEYWRPLAQLTVSDAITWSSLRHRRVINTAWIRRWHAQKGSNWQTDRTEDDGGRWNCRIRSSDVADNPLDAPDYLWAPHSIDRNP